MYKNLDIIKLKELCTERKIQFKDENSKKELIALLKADDKAKGNGDVVYNLSARTIQLGYKAKIDGKIICVTPANETSPAIVEMQNGFNTSDGSPIMEQTDSGQVENPSDQMLYELVNAGVIKMTPEQEKAFRSKFYGIKDKK